MLVVITSIIKIKGLNVGCGLEDLGGGVDVARYTHIRELTDEVYRWRMQTIGTGDCGGMMGRGYGVQQRKMEQGVDSNN